MTTSNVTSNSATAFGAGTVSTTVSGVSAGDIIAVGVSYTTTGGPCTSVSDGTAYTQVDVSADTNGSTIETWYLQNSSSGSKTVTATFTGSPGRSDIWVDVISGGATSGALDAHAVQAFPSLTPGTDAISFNLTLSQTGDYIFAFDRNTSQNGNVTAGTGYTQSQTTTTATAQEYLANFGSSGTKAVTFTSSGGSSETHIAGAMAFKALALSPTIDAQPTQQTAAAGATATFSVTATGATSYQWQQYNGTSFADISGATSSSYTTPTLTSADNDERYRVNVTNANGTVTSAESAMFLTGRPITGKGRR